MFIGVAMLVPIGVVPGVRAPDRVFSVGFEAGTGVMLVQIGVKVLVVRAPDRVSSVGFEAGAVVPKEHGLVEVVLRVVSL